MRSRRARKFRYLPYCQLSLLLAGSLLVQVSHAHGDKHNDEPPVILAPGYAELNFAPAAVGSYELPVLGSAGDGEVLTSNGEVASLGALLGEKPVLLSFIYTSCDDVNGCPLASYVLGQVAQRIVAEPMLKDSVRLLSLSFDPSRDTPQIMADYGANFRPAGADWEFLTCRDEPTLEPILAKYNQSIAQELEADGTSSGRYSHILRVYLIDAERRFRNIYSVSFLHADTIVNDLKTLLNESPSAGLIKVANSASDLHGAGDEKAGYERKTYETQSDYLPNRRGDTQDLLSLSNPAPLGLPALPSTPQNPMSAAKVALGRKLFFDRRLSLNQTISCAMCHVPEQGFAHNELATAVGLEGRTVRRNAPTIYNIGYMQRLFHDARDDRLEHQIWQPLLARNEMANPSISAVVNKLRALPDYQQLFEQAFDGTPIEMKSIGMALASYERALVSGNSAFDQWHFADKESTMSASAKRGFELFSGRANCTGCHLINDDYALFTDHAIHNTGIGYERSMRPSSDQPQRVLLAPGVFIDVVPGAVAASSEKPPADLGYYEISQDPNDRWKYRTPSLRNIALTAPYMHDGSLTSLAAVVEFYDRGGIDNELLDPLIKPLNLSASERADLVAFLKSLTGDTIDAIIADAFAAPVGNATDADKAPSQTTPPQPAN